MNLKFIYEKEHLHNCVDAFIIDSNYEVITLYYCEFFSNFRLIMCYNTIVFILHSYRRTLNDYKL